MTSLFEGIDFYEGIDDCDPQFPLDDLRSQYNVDAIDEGNSWLVWDEAGIVLRAALVQFAQSNAHGGDIRVTIVFETQGLTGELRQGRHTYFGPWGAIELSPTESRGYLFYAPFEDIAKAMLRLGEWFEI